MRAARTQADKVTAPATERVGLGLRASPLVPIPREKKLPCHRRHTRVTVPYALYTDARPVKQLAFILALPGPNMGTLRELR